MTVRRYALSLLSERPQPTGIGTYGAEVARAMGPLLEEDERLVVIRHADFPACGGHPLVEEAALRFPAARTSARRLAEQTLLPLVALRRRASLVHGLNYVLPLGWRGPTVLTLNDVRLYLERVARGGRSRALAELVFGRSVRRATRLLAISDDTAARCARAFGVPRERFAVMPLGVDAAAFARVDDAARAAARARAGVGDGPFVLFVGELEPQKNVPRLVDAFAAAPAPAVLALAGGRGSQLEEVRRRVRERGLEARVRFTPYLARADLVALISAATALALPSLDEGFGMPLLEGFAAGTPVLASRAGALPETGGDAALYVDAEDTGSIGEGLRRLLVDDALRRRLIDAGRRRVARFTWERAARATLSAYRGAAG